MNIIFGALYDANQSDSCRITVIATGLEDATLPTNKPMSPYGGTFSGKYMKPVAPSLSSIRQGVNDGVGGNPVGTGTAPMPHRPVPGINSPGDLRSNVADKPLKIPDFLQKK